MSYKEADVVRSARPEGIKNGHLFLSCIISVGMFGDMRATLEI